MLQYEPGVTHLLCPDDMSDTDFLKHSKFSSISDIPKDVVCVKVNWLHESIQMSFVGSCGGSMTLMGVVG